MRSIVNSAPQNLEQVNDPSWQEQSVCFRTLIEADEATAKADAEVRADFEECRNYWIFEWPTLSEKTRSIISLSFSMLVRPFITRPLRQLFCADTNIQPEAAFTGKILIIDLPVQEYRLAGKIASLTWKFCFQIAVLRRLPPEAGHLLPVFLWADEAQNFVTSFDAEYQAVARSAGGCTVYLTQNRESYRRALGNYDAVDSLLGNLNCKMFCQNSSTETNEWAAKLLGERWLQITGTNYGQSRNDGNNTGTNSGSHSSGINRSEQRRYFVEASRFTTLKRGGAKNNYQVDTIVYNGGHLFDDGCEQLPFRMLTFNQR